ncbi:hypothetical protein BJV82DRAFT_712503 [Fennellomyces sp. T-0311]|nr:hypothetical protein BJV82DRAFT_712503 [Fennellomyces sp. T-0311]
MELAKTVTRMTHPPMLTVRRYQDANTFLNETRQELEVSELEHSFPLWAASVLAQGALGNSYCGAVFNGSKLVYALVAFDEGMAFTTLILDETVEPREAVKMLVDDVCSAPVVIKRIQGDSNLVFAKEAWNGQLDLHFKLWVYVFLREDISQLNNKNDDTFFLRQVTPIELPMLMEWTITFYQDCGLRNVFNEEENYSTCAQQIQQGNAYFWCHRDKGPVSMIWKRRPMSQGCSIGYVFTPSTYRGRGYGGNMVAAFTRMLLQDYSYTTLSVDGKRHPHDNMYTRVGYRLVREVDEYVVTNKKQSI